MTLKKILLALLCLVSIIKSFSQTTLIAGDIAFTGLNSTFNTLNDFVNTPQTESNKEFCFVLVKSVTSGTTIFFTDFGWRSDAQAFQSANPCGPSTGAVTDGVVRWQATTNLPYGTQVMVRCVTNPKATVGTASGFQGTFNVPTEYMTLASGGESIIAFTGTLAAPTLISAINARTTGWIATLNNCDFTPTPSTLPNVLNNAMNGNQNFAFAVLPSGSTGFCMRLKPTVKIGPDPAAARATIYSGANWESNGSATPYSLPGTSGSLVLPVTFGTIEAIITEKDLSVSWQTTSEMNSRQYMVEASVDGTTWKKISTVQSKASNGNSSLPLRYEITTDLAGISFALSGLLVFLLIPKGRKRLLVVTGLAILVVIACNKSNSNRDIVTDQKVYVRILQEDIDGTINYSKIVQAHIR